MAHTQTETQCTECYKDTPNKQRKIQEIKDIKVDLIMRSALPEDLEQQRKGIKDMANVKISMEILRMSILNLLANMTKDTPLTLGPAAPHPNNEAPWLWFTTATLEHPI